MNIAELKEILEQYPEDTEVKFEDVCGNWSFEIYQSEEQTDTNGKIILCLIGDETYDE